MGLSQKILIFSTAYYPFVGGVEVAIREITDRISGARFDLITAKLKRDLPKFERIGNVNVYRLGIGIPFFDKLFLPFWGAIKTISLNKKNHYDAFWCVMVTFASGAAYIANILSFKKVPIILTLQEGDSEKHLRYRWFGLIDLSWCLALKKSSVVTAISFYLANRAKKLGYRKEIKIIPNGVDIDYFNTQSKKLLPPFNHIHLVTTSRLVEKNGIEDVVKAMPYLLDKSPMKFKFLIFGEGVLRKKLENIAKNLGLMKEGEEKVIFYGYIDHDRIIDFFKKQINVLQIFIRPSLSEGMGNSFIEAMAAGIPVIGTKIGGIPDFLKDGKTGLFCEVKNPQSIVQKVMEYINNPELISEVTENAYKMVKENYNWDLIAKRMEKIFNVVK